MWQVADNLRLHSFPRVSKMNNDSNELLLSKEEQRYVIFPIKQDVVWDMYKKAVANFWTPEEIDLEKDLTDYQNLTDDEQHFINMVLAFFAASASGSGKKEEPLSSLYRAI